MSDSHGRHDEATAAALRELEELRGRIAASAEQAQLCLGYVVNAVGDPARTEAGQNTTAFIAATLDALNEVLGVATQAHFELERYRGGF